MKKNQMKHLSKIDLGGKAEGVTVILEAIKNSTMGCPRYEAIVIWGGAYKVRVEGYMGTRDLAFEAYQKVASIFATSREEQED